jgi:uncharacterized protein DUF5906
MADRDDSPEGQIAYLAKLREENPFRDQRKQSDAPPDPAVDDVVKEFSAFVSEIIHLPQADSCNALQTEKSITILARMKIHSSSDRPRADDVKGIFIILLEHSKEVFEKNERRKWVARIYNMAKELLPESRKLETPDDFMPELNKVHAIVPLEGQRIIVQVAPNGRAIWKLKPQDLRLAYHNRFTKDVNDKKVIGIDQYWLDSPARPNYGGSTFQPNPNVILRPDTFNWFRGFAVRPVYGANIDPILEYVLTGLCKNNNDYFNWLIQWSAHIFQKPWEKPGTSPVIRSDEEGTGKSFYFRRILGTLMDGDDGTHLYFAFSNPNMLTGDFSGHIENNLLLHSEEAFSAESKKEDSIIKNIITEDYVSINPKNLQARFIKSYHRVAFTGNPVHVIKVSVHGRRFFVLVASDKYKENTEFFGNLMKLLANSGAEALMYYFMHVDLRDFDPRVAPRTEYLLDQQIESFDSIENFWLESLQLGETPFDVDTHKKLSKIYVIKQKMLNHFNRTQKNNHRKEMINMRSFGRQFAKFFKSLGLDGDPIMLKDAKTADGYNAYHIPPLPVARQLFENYMHQKYRWNDKIEWTYPPFNTD